MFCDEHVNNMSLNGKVAQTQWPFITPISDDRYARIEYWTTNSTHANTQPTYVKPMTNNYSGLQADGFLTLIPIKKRPIKIKGGHSDKRAKRKIFVDSQ